MATLEDYKYIKSYYTGAGEGNNSNLGKITFSVPNDAVELPYKAQPGYSNQTVYWSGDIKQEITNGVLTQNTNPAGYFYFLRIGDIFIADRIVAIGTSYQELYNSGYIDGKFRALSQSEYESILSSDEEKTKTDIWHTLNTWGAYSGFYGEISSTLNQSNSNQVWIYGYLGVKGNWVVTGDFYYTQTAQAWNSITSKNYLTGGNGPYYMPGCYRPVIDIKNMRITIINNLELSE